MEDINATWIGKYCLFLDNTNTALSMDSACASFGKVLALNLAARVAEVEDLRIVVYEGSDITRLATDGPTVRWNNTRIGQKVPKGLVVGLQQILECTPVAAALAQNYPAWEPCYRS